MSHSRSWSDACQRTHFVVFHQTKRINNDYSTKWKHILMAKIWVKIWFYGRLKFFFSWGPEIPEVNGFLRMMQLVILSISRFKWEIQGPHSDVINVFVLFESKHDMRRYLCSHLLVKCPKTHSISYVTIRTNIYNLQRVVSIMKITIEYWIYILPEINKVLRNFHVQENYLLLLRFFCESLSEK